MNFDTELVSNLLKTDKVTARRMLKTMALLVALESTAGKEVRIEYLGTLYKRSRNWSFRESEYLKTIREKKMTPSEFLDSILTEDDNLNDRLSSSYKELE